ncbi:hypothetical protein EV127DRAFT_404468 [Xylaria flabelliformis]|nr:hypothetical protein EV127DRAFT_404468 [Xylaria flabelliformis]
MDKRTSVLPRTRQTDDDDQLSIASTPSDGIRDRSCLERKKGNNVEGAVVGTRYKGSQVVCKDIGRLQQQVLSTTQQQQQQQQQRQQHTRDMCARKRCSSGFLSPTLESIPTYSTRSIPRILRCTGAASTTISAQKSSIVPHISACISACELLTHSTLHPHGTQRRPSSSAGHNSWACFGQDNAAFVVITVHPPRQNPRVGLLIIDLPSKAHSAAGSQSAICYGRQLPTCDVPLVQASLPHLKTADLRRKTGVQASRLRRIVVCSPRFFSGSCAGVKCSRIVRTVWGRFPLFWILSQPPDRETSNDAAILFHLYAVTWLIFTQSAKLSNIT